MDNTYTKDANDQEIVVDKTGFQVMMEWEKPYMKALIDNLNPIGNVLEIGFGLGYSASNIQKKNITSHTIIEPDNTTIKICRDWASQQQHPVTIIQGTWQEQLSNLGKFDSIFFDDAPNDKHPDPYNIRIYDFYYRILDNHANKNCKMSWYCDTAIYWLNNPFTDFNNSLYNINVSNQCNYVEQDASLASMPIIKFKYGCVPGMKRYAFTNTCEVIELAQ